MEYAMSEKRRSFRIRETQDVDLVKKLHSKIFTTDDWYEPVDPSSPVIYWLVYDANNIAVGFCILTMLKDETCFLSRSGILYEARGNGLQVRMIRVRESYARKYHYKKMVTYTTMENIASSHNLQKVSYQLYMPSEEWAGPGCLYWQRSI